MKYPAVIVLGTFTGGILLGAGIVGTRMAPEWTWAIVVSIVLLVATALVAGLE